MKILLGSMLLFAGMTSLYSADTTTQEHITHNQDEEKNTLIKVTSITQTSRENRERRNSMSAAKRYPSPSTLDRLKKNALLPLQKSQSAPKLIDYKGEGIQ